MGVLGSFKRLSAWTARNYLREKHQQLPAAE
jgi:hypothetical protein